MRIQPMTYDSRPETYEHIATVQSNLIDVVKNLLNRVCYHDYTKLIEPELSGFNTHTPKLRGTTYGTPEYEKLREELNATLEHHYRHNSHHPEHYSNGIRGMNLLDLIEMLCDWEAATQRHHDGNLAKSIEINQKRFGYSDEMKDILMNTAKYLDFLPIENRK